MKLSRNESIIVNYLALLIGLILFVIIYFFRLIFKLLFKLKRWLFRLAIVIFILYNGMITHTFYVNAPYANASEFQYTQKPQTEKEQIVKYIYDRFGSNAPEALKVFKCESGLRPDAVNTNWSKTPGVASSYDYGIAQINSVHQVGKNYLLDWHTNIDVAYKIFSEQGWTPWVCRYVLKGGN